MKIKLRKISKKENKRKNKTENKNNKETRSNNSNNKNNNAKQKIKSNRKTVKKLLSIIIILTILDFIFIFSSIANSFENNKYNDKYYDYNNYEQPKDFFKKTDISFTPKDRIKESQIKVYRDKIIIELKNAEWSKFKDTGSMKPFLDEKSNAIEVKPKSEKDLQIGDIVSYNYNENGKNITVIHRIIKIGYDDKGWYAITKGDNNKEVDPKKVRFSQIKRVLVAIIY